MLWMYLGFITLVLLLLALDLGVFHRKAHVIHIKESIAWSAFWIFLGLLFAIFIYFGYENHWLGLGLTYDQMSTPAQIASFSEKSPSDATLYNDGPTAALKYVTGYLVEKSLAIDNIFVIAMLFGFFAVPPIYQHRVLFWGIIGALLMRGIMIALGAALIAKFHWILYVFGAFLILTSIKMLLIQEAKDPNQNIIVRWTRRLIPISEKYHGQHFFVRAGKPASLEAATPDAPREHDSIVAAALPGTLLATPLFLVLVLIEFTDLIFAVDSIPAIFAITTDPFIVFTSNVFAILGLRSLYFALASMIHKFHYLKISLACVLALVGIKMLTHSWLKSIVGENFNLYLLILVLLILTAGVIASLVFPKRHPADLPTPSTASDHTPIIKS